MYNEIFFQLIEDEKYTILAVCLTNEIDDKKYCYYGAYINGTFVISLDLINDENCLNAKNDYNTLSLERLNEDVLNNGNSTNKFTFLLPYNILVDWLNDYTINGCENVKECLDFVNRILNKKEKDFPMCVWHKLVF